MNQRPLRELNLQDFRCFRERQTARVAPLTLLVGENSTGKTSFLAAVRAVLEVANYHGDPDFRSPRMTSAPFPRSLIVGTRTAVGPELHRSDSVSGAPE